MSELDDLKRKLVSLQRKFDDLSKRPDNQREIVTVVGTYKGFPVLKFEGSFRPFAIGLKKAWVILQKLEDVRFFVESNKQKLKAAPGAGESEAA